MGNGWQVKKIGYCIDCGEEFFYYSRRKALRCPQHRREADLKCMREWRKAHPYFGPIRRVGRTRVKRKPPEVPDIPGWDIDENGKEIMIWANPRTRQKKLRS